MATLDPLATYDTATAARLVGVSEEFLVGLVGRAVKSGYMKLAPGWMIRGADLSMLGRRYHGKFEAELHYQARLRIDARDEAERRERLERSA